MIPKKSMNYVISSAKLNAKIGFFFCIFIIILWFHSYCNTQRPTTTFQCHCTENIKLLHTNLHVISKKPTQLNTRTLKYLKFSLFGYHCSYMRTKQPSCACYECVLVVKMCTYTVHRTPPNIIPTKFVQQQQ